MTNRFDVRRGLGLILLVIGLVLPVIYFVSQSTQPAPRSTLAPTATRIVERLIPTVASTAPVTTVVTLAPTRPTRTALAIATATASFTPRALQTTARLTTTPATRAATRAATQAATRTTTRMSATVAPAATVTPDQPPTLSPTPAPATVTPHPVAVSGLRQRFGIGVSLPTPWIQRLTALKPGWFLDWSSLAPAGRPTGPEYMRMVRLSQGQPRPTLAELAGIAQRSPGSLWLIGNEPDVIWQDNSTPDQYVQAYHDVYSTLKQADPSSRIAIAGVSQPTPLRMQYLDRILTLYREHFGEDMPVDVWNVHNFILPERRGDWGADIPPGFTVNSGLIVDIEDHDNLARFKQQIVDFRRWMADRGFRDKELIVSEYGVLMYEDFGFDYERVRTFMLGTFDYFLSATDGAIGLPSDGNRLVQRWCWYSLSDTQYPTGNLVDRATGELTPLGQDFVDYLNSH